MISKELNSLKESAQKSLEEARRLELLQSEFPDLRKHKGRWGKVVYCSASVNSKVTDYEQRYNCGCCNDSPLELWPYLETPNGRVYSDPTGIFIGERSSYTSKAIPGPGWRERLQKLRLPEALINNVSLLFEEDDRDQALDLVESETSDPLPEPLI